MTALSSLISRPLVAFRGIRLKFESLKSIMNVSNDLELIIHSPEWHVTKAQNSIDGTWLTEEEFIQLFNVLNEFKNNETVYVFETFERVYKSSGLTKRLNQKFQLNWSNFEDFQHSTEILCFYLVPENLSWVPYANRDAWQFAKGN